MAAPPRALAAFEHEFGVSLPSDLRDYFLTMDGMPEEETDKEMIRFWRLEEVKALPTGGTGLFTKAGRIIWFHPKL